MPRLEVGEHLHVLVERSIVESTPCRLDTCPFDAHTEGVVPEIHHELVVVAPAIPVVTGPLAGGVVFDQAELFPLPPVARPIVPLDLVACRCRSPPEALWKIHAHLLVADDQAPRHEAATR